MFWGLVLEPGKKYSRTVDSAFRLTSAVLDTEDFNEKDITRIMLIHNNKQYLLGNLGGKINIYQIPLDLEFMIGDEISFYTSGSENKAHLVGYVLEDLNETLGEYEDEDGEECLEEEECEDSDDEEEESDDEEVPVLTTGKRKLNGDVSSLSKKKKMDSTPENKKKNEKAKSPLLKNFTNELIEAQAESDSEDSDFEGGEEEEEDEEDSDDEISDLDEEEDMEQEETEPQKPAKSPKQKVKAEVQTNTPKSEKKKKQKLNESIKTEEKSKADQSVNKTPKSEKKKKNKEMNGETPKQNGTSPKVNTTSPKPSKVVKSGGVVSEDLKVGTGADVKNGKHVSVYYEGKLKNNNKTFDKCVSGAPFKFRLGANEVIKGWDVGINGMKVGGKRRLTIPPNMAYGKSGAPPSIPPNATLVFEVEIKGAN